MTEKEELIGAYKSYMRNRMYVRGVQCAEEVYKRDLKDGKFIMRDFREKMIYEIQTGGKGECMDVSRRSYMFTAPYCFDDFMIAMEWNRNPKSRFWLPRRKILEGKFGVCTSIENFMNEEGGHKLCLSTPPGCGKALANDTPVLTRNGWKNHGDLCVGDEVIGADGKFKKVLRVFPKVLVDRKMNFTNGESIICHAQHEWMFYDHNGHIDKLEETQYYEKRTLSNGEPDKRGHRYTFLLPIIHVEGEERDLPLDPYTFGVWLGDGANKNPTICNNDADNAIIEKIISHGIIPRWETRHKTTGVMYYGFGFRPQLQSMGLCHSRRTTPKHIPECYLMASEKQRLELLAGLIDTDGYVQNHKYQFTTNEEILRDDVITLISSFGWKNYYITREPQVSSSGVHARKEHYVISFIPDKSIPCALERKRVSAYGKQMRIALKSIETVQPVEGNCIEVEDGMYLVGKTLIPTHNSTLIKFLMAFIMGKYPDSKNMYISYSDGMVKMMMDAEIDMTTGDEYNFQEIFPLGKPDKSAEYNTIGYRPRGDAQTFNMCSIGGSITGRTRADKFQITDDLVKNAEMARSPERLETLYNDYTDTISTRQIGDEVKEIMLGTIWSIYDPISREKIKYDGIPGYHFIALPVCDEEGHSNFAYDCPDNYTDEKIAQIKEKLDPVTFSCLYMQRGIQKEGMPFTTEQLRWYDGILPDGEPDTIFAFCDVAYGGGDSLSMPMCWKYGHDGFIHDVVFNRKDKSITVPIVGNRLAKNKVRKVRFEANVGGDIYADEVSAFLKTIGYSCNVTSKRAPNTMSKLSKIEQYQQDIRNLYFRRDKDRGVEYDRYINELTSFSFTQKNLHDDAADSTAGLCDMENSTPKIVVLGHRPF